MEVGNLNGKEIRNFNGYGIVRWCLIFMERKLKNLINRKVEPLIVRRSEILMEKKLEI